MMITIATISKPILLILVCITACNSIVLPPQVKSLKNTGVPAVNVVTTVTTPSKPAVCMPKSLNQIEEYFASYAVTHHPHSLETCNMMTRKLNDFAPSSKSSCPWEYTCDHDENRFPKYIIKAKCLNDYFESCNKEGNDVLGVCRPVTIPLTVYKCADNTEQSFLEGSWTTENVVLACQCDNTNIISSR